MSFAALPNKIGIERHDGKRPCLNKLNKLYLLLRTNALLAREVSIEHMRLMRAWKVPVTGAVSNTVKRKAPTVRRLLIYMVKIGVCRRVEETCVNVEQESEMVRG